MKHNLLGSIWRQWDLHLHTPSSYDYGDKSVSDEDIIQTLLEEEVSVVAVTDHHVMDVARIRHLQQIYFTWPYMRLLS